MNWPMARQDVIFEAPGLTSSVTIHNLEDVQRTAVFTVECGFFSAARLQHLFSLLFTATVEELIVRGNDDWEASYEQGPQLREWSSQDFY